MDGLRAQGVCDWIGLTGLGDPGALKAVIDSGRFDAVQIYYNLLNPTAMAPAGPGWSSTDFDGLLHRCAAQDMGVMGIRIFAAGHLATSERHGREVAITANAENAAEAARARRALGGSGSAARHGRADGIALRARLSTSSPPLSSASASRGTSTRPWPPPRWGRCRMRRWPPWRRYGAIIRRSGRSAVAEIDPATAPRSPPAPAAGSRAGPWR